MKYERRYDSQDRNCVNNTINAISVCKERASFLVAYTLTPLLYMGRISSEMFPTPLPSYCGWQTGFIPSFQTEAQTMPQETWIHPQAFPSFLLCHSFSQLLSKMESRMRSWERRKDVFPQKNMLGENTTGKRTKHQPSRPSAMKTGSTKSWKVWQEHLCSLSVWCRVEGTARHISVNKNLSDLLGNRSYLQAVYD